MPIIIPANSAAGGGGYEVTNSARFNPASNDRLTRTPSSDGSRVKWTWSCWAKRGTVNQDLYLFGAYQNSSYNTFLKFASGGEIRFADVYGGSEQARINTLAKFRDLTAWYHIVVVYDKDNSTATNRLIMYVNGVRITEFDGSTMTSQASTYNVDGIEIQIGALNGDGDMNGYISEVCFIDNQALAPTSFGEFDEDSGIWKPIDGLADLTFGTNGYYLEMKEAGTSANSSGMGADTSGNDHHFAVNGLTAIDQTTDTCTNNFATLNPLYPTGGGYDNQSGATFTEGATIFTTDNGDADWGFCSSSILVASGKWYVEVKYVSTDNGSAMIGIRSTPSNNDNAYIGRLANGVSYMANGDGDGDKKVAATQSAYATEGYAAGDIIGVALDLDNNKIYFSKNGTFVNSGDPTSGSTGTGAIAVTAAASTVMGGYLIGASEVNSNGNAVFNFNFGNPSFSISSSNADGSGFGNFEYAVPSGYFALCSKNLAGNS